MDKVQVTFTNTGEVKSYEKASLMVASNGTIFIKQSGRTVFASNSETVIAEVI